MISIKTKLALLLVLVALLPLVTMGTALYFQMTNNVTQSIQQSLLTIVKLKENALENYIESTEGIGRAIAETTAMQDYIRLATRDNLTRSESVRKRFMERQVQNILLRFQESHWGKYHHIFLVDRTHKIVISPDHDANEAGAPSYHVGRDISQNRWATEALERGMTQVSDYSSWIASDHAHQMLFYPIKNADGLPLAVIGFELQIPYEQGILANDLQLGETGRIFLMSTQGIPVVYQGIENQQAQQTPGFREALQSGFSSGRRVNAAGIEVIDLYLKNEKYPWVVAAEIEAREAFGDLYQLQKLILTVTGITLVIAVLVSIFFANTIVNPIRTLTGQMEQISLGNFAITLDENSRKDEIGKLVQAFQRIVVSLRIAMKQIKDKGEN